MGFVLNQTTPKTCEGKILDNCQTAKFLSPILNFAYGLPNILKYDIHQSQSEYF